MTVTVLIPGLRILSTNKGEHWTTRSKRRKDEKELVAYELAQLSTKTKKLFQAAPQVLVTFTRIGGRGLDDDNLAGGFKAPRDQVATWLKKDDKPGSGLTWKYLQEPGKLIYSVRLELTLP